MISIIVPALNEQERIRMAVEPIVRVLRVLSISGFEIFVIDDGSTDQTSERVRELTTQYPEVKLLRHETNLGFGACFETALKHIKTPYLSVLPGDFAVSEHTMHSVYSKLGAADIVVAYFLNTEVRTPFRNALSTVFNLLHCMVFRVHLKYLQGTPIFNTERVKDLSITSKSYGVLTEIQVKLLRQGASFLEVEGYFNTDNKKSSAIGLKPLIALTRAFISLWWEVCVVDAPKYSHRPKRVLPEKGII